MFVISHLCAQCEVVLSGDYLPSTQIILRWFLYRWVVGIGQAHDYYIVQCLWNAWDVKYPSDVPRCPVSKVPLAHGGVRRYMHTHVSSIAPLKTRRCDCCINRLGEKCLGTCHISRIGTWSSESNILTFKILFLQYICVHMGKGC